ncbi:MAG TPA: hypothetical protein VH083_00670, partial [Myxococcales bacterium]|nr:hypothetical protein [Myxococcales bacterium]
MTACTEYRCDNPLRREAVRANAVLSGIDYLEVVDEWALEHPGSPRQRTLLVHLFKPVPADLGAANVAISGGTRVTGIRVKWAWPAAAIPAGLLTPDETAMIAAAPDVPNLFVVRVAQAGDFSTYTLALVQAAGSLAPPADFDPKLSSVDFSFKVECPAPFDCAPQQVCPPVALEEPRIDYLAKDYSSFRRLLLDRLSVTMPAWTERGTADIGVTLVELLAYAADHLSYYQDAVATEAYLGTARRRVSVRRHARLLDYAMHDGCNARAWVSVGWSGETAVLPQGTPLLTGGSGVLDATGYAEAVEQGARVFETLHPQLLDEGLNEIDLYTWGDDGCSLPKGATRATLVNDGGRLSKLQAGAVLVFEEVRSPQQGLAPDPAHRHAVRLTSVDLAATDPLYLEPTGAPQQRLAEIAWDVGDALPFALNLQRIDPGASHDGAGAGTVTWGGTNLRSLRIALRIDAAGAPGAAFFSWSGDGGKTFNASQLMPAAGNLADAPSGISVVFAGQFVAGDVYWFGPAPVSVARGNVVLADDGRTMLGL